MQDLTNPDSKERENCNFFFDFVQNCITKTPHREITGLYLMTFIKVR